MRKTETFVIFLLPHTIFLYIRSLGRPVIHIGSRMTAAKSRREFTRRESSLASESSSSSSSQTGELLKSIVVKRIQTIIPRFYWCALQAKIPAGDTSRNKLNFGALQFIFWWQLAWLHRQIKDQTPEVYECSWCNCHVFYNRAFKTTEKSNITLGVSRTLVALYCGEREFQLNYLK